jgi:predicted O-methyltransferase YrrM
MCDDVLWHGRVADPRAKPPEAEDAVAFNARLFHDRLLQSVSLPFANGVFLSMVNKS